MDTESLYEAADPVEARIVVNLLEAHGIACRVMGQFGWGGRGDLPINVYPRLHLQNPSDRPRATALLREYQQQDDGGDDAWRCKKCGETSGERFDACWQCGQARAG